MRKNCSLVSREPGNHLAWILDHPKALDYLSKCQKRATCSFEVPSKHKPLFVKKELVAERSEWSDSDEDEPGAIVGDSYPRALTNAYPLLQADGQPSRANAPDDPSIIAPAPPYRFQTVATAQQVIETQLIKLAKLMQQMCQIQLEQMRSQEPEECPAIAEVKIRPFDQEWEAPDSWLMHFEQCCEDNGWITERQKMNAMLSYIGEGTVAKSWAATQLGETDLTWAEWKRDFALAFRTNPITLIQRAYDCRYKHGDLLDWYYKKSRLLSMALPNLSEENFLNLVKHGLPNAIQDKLRAAKTLRELRGELAQLRPWVKRGRKKRS